MVASATQRRAVKEAHQRLRGQVTEMILLSHSTDSDAAVLPQFVRRVVDALDARRGTIWAFGAGGAIARYCMHQPANVSSESLASARLDDQILMQLAASEAGGVVVKDDVLAARAGIAPPRAQAAIVVPIHRHGTPWGVMEVLPALDSTERVQRETLTFVRHMARVLSHRLSRGPAVAVSEEIAPQSFMRMSVPAVAAPVPSTPTRPKPAQPPPEPKHNDVILAFHESLDLETTALIIANEFRQALRCDRVSIVATQGTNRRVLAVSGQEVINRRADVVRQLEILAQLVRDETDPRWLERESLDVPVHLSAAIDRHREISPWQHLGLIPLRTDNESAQTSAAAAVLIVEQMTSVQASNVADVTNKLAPHAAQALANAAAQQQLPMLPLWKALGRLRSNLVATSRRKLATTIGGVALGIGLLTFVPMSFHVQGQGALQPVAQRDVFADVAGVVTAIHVGHGDQVEKGDVLLELRNTDLDVQIADILGQRRSAQEQLASFQRMRHAEQIDRAEENRLTGQILQLQGQLKGLDEQHRLLQQKKDRLVVRSPMTGQVATWNIHRQLMLRPVAPGQVLLTISDNTGPWNLEVYLPESEAGHLLAVSGARGQGVNYVVASQPTVTHAGQLEHVDAVAQLYDEHGHALRVLVKVDKDDLPEAPAGTTVTARIHCGHRSIGYVWLHRLIDFVHTRILFPLF